MYSQRKLIDGIHSLYPSRENWVSKTLGYLPNYVTVHFKTGQTGRLDLKDPLSAHWASMIDKQEQANQPVYVEIDEETSVITNVLVPRVFTVERLETDERGNLLVHLHQSSAIHAVLQSDPDFAAMRDSLKTALDDGSERQITSTRDDLEIIDVRAPTSNPSGPSETASPPAPDPPVSPERATEIFNDMNSETCVACNPSSTCIPFLFPDDGCWIRGHLMAYDMRGYSPPEDPEKIYIQGSLDPFVPNHPDCRLPFGWGWHIAPTLMVTLPGGNQRRVIDPSLASTPISETDWENLNNSSTTPTITILPWTVYNPRISGSTATDAQAQSDMQFYRDALKTRCLQYGPPPYNCTKNCFFIIDRSTFSDDEIEAMLHLTGSALVEAAFYIVVDGFKPQDLGFTSATMQYTPTLTISPSIMGMTITPVRLEFEYPTHLNRRQRLTWVYDISFANTSGFTSALITVTLQASMAAVSSTSYLYLIQQPEPYEIDGATSWLSTDLRVFQIKEGDPPKLGATMGSDPSAFITEVIGRLNNGTAGQTFENAISDNQQTSHLELSSTVGGTPVYNFAVVKVHYRSRFTPATDVRVFFRLFPVATTSLEYNQATAYRRSSTGAVPLLGINNNEVTAIPCFASPRVDSAVASLSTQIDAPNVQPIPADSTGAEVIRYFGCWLDINQTQPQFPLQLPAANRDGPFTSGRVSIQDHIRNEHQCLVAEIVFGTAPPNGSTPSVSDKLAQRNLAIVESANPGIVFSRRIPQTFEIRPSTSRQEPDELMIDWGNIPAGSIATFYLPGIAASDILRLAARKYRSHRLVRIDEHTLKCDTGGITYLPIPFTDSNLAGMLTVDLPEGIKKGQVFKAVVRQVTGEPQPIILTRGIEVTYPSWRHTVGSFQRHIVGSFQLTIPVRDKAEILPGQLRLLSNLRWIERAIPENNRWSPVFSKYVSQIARRVDALGGDSTKVAPSPSGQWQEAYKTCLIFMLATALLIAVVVVSSGTLAGGVAALSGLPVVALLAGTVYLWRKKCRPTTCQLLLALLVGSAGGALILSLVALFGQSTPPVVAALLVSVGVAAATAIGGRMKGCIR